jgi:Xaa-Pro dipeptidase
MITTSTATRIEKLAARLREDAVDAFFTQNEITMGYLQGFREHAGERFMAMAVNPEGEVRLICPALSESQARRAGFTNIKSWKDGEDPVVLFNQLTSEWNLDTAIVSIDPEMPARQLLVMQHHLMAALFRDADPILASLMRVKDAAELDHMRHAARIADAAFEEVLPKIKEGMTEKEIDGLLVNAMESRGAKRYFCIVAASANGAEPHHFSDDTKLKEGDVVVLDFGCDIEGYKSDITRTIAIGEPSARAKEMYRLVYQAFRAGREAIRPGVAAKTLDAAARNVINNAGVGEAFFHRLGHGIGLQGHEAPYINGQNEEILEVGNCFSIEPGVYFEGQFGIRIENIVTVSEDGHESFNAEPSPEILCV